MRNLMKRTLLAYIANSILLVSPFMSVYSQQNNTTILSQVTTKTKNMFSDVIGVNELSRRRDSIACSIHTWFEKQVSEYFDATHKKAREKLVSDQQIIKELLYALDRAAGSRSPGQSIALLSRIRSAYDTAKIQGYEAVQNTIEEQARCALLLKISVQIAQVAREVFIELLYKLDKYERYWKTQQNHPTHYFLHKSPIKWISGKSQEKEIQDNLEIIHTAQQHYYTKLGMVTSYLHTFDSKLSVQKQYKWVDALLKMLPGKSEQVNSISFESVAQNMQFKLGKILSHKNTIFKKLASAKKPHHIVRHWMGYTALAAGAVMAAAYWKKNPEKVDALVGPKALSSYADSFKRSFSQYLVQPLKDMWKIVFDNTELKKPSFENEITTSKKKIDESVAIAKELRDEVTANKEEFLNSFFETLEGALKGKEITQEEHDQMFNAAKQGNSGPLLNYWRKLKKEGTKWHLVNGRLAQVSLDVLGIAALLPAIILMSHAEDKLADVSELIYEARVSIQYVVDLIHEFKKENQVTLKFTALIPMLIVSYGTYKGISKLYQWFVTKDFNAIRHALAQINSILIESPSNMSDRDYGKLIYLLHKLQYKAMQNVSRSNNMRDEFFEDILKLESHDFSVDEKRAMIANMRAHYSFLSPVFQG
jgi:hypothetical protein